MVLPREANRAFYDAVLATCGDAGLSPSLSEIPDGLLEPALLAVASGAGMALVPSSAAERYLAPDVRFVPLADPQPTVAGAVATRRDTTHLPTAAFLRTVSLADPTARTSVPRSTVATAA